MKITVTRALRLDRPAKATGWCPVQLTATWRAQRKRFLIDTFVDPKNWDDDRQRVKPGKPFAKEVNDLLDEWERTITEEAETAADPAALGAAVLARLSPEKLAKARPKSAPAAALLAPNAPAPAPARAGATADNLVGLWQEWVESCRSRVSGVTKELLSDDTIEQYRGTLDKIVAWAGHTRTPLTLGAVCTTAFYESFRAWCLREAGYEVNTFGRFIKQLKNFLGWCESQDDERRWPPSPRWHQFEAPSRYVGVDFLDVDEVRALQQIDFKSPKVIEHVEQSFLQFDKAAPQRQQGGRKSQLDARRVTERLRMLETARDVFLMCCYTGLRISDIEERLGPQHIRGKALSIEVGKNRVRCIIPFFDDELMRPGELVRKYASKAPKGLLLPFVSGLNDYLHQVGELAGLTRLTLTTKYGRKTFVTLSVYQGIPTRIIMQATGHQTEKSFNRYLGVNIDELVKAFQKRALKPNPILLEAISEAE